MARVLASVRGAGSSPHQLGLGPAIDVVDDLVDRAWLEAGLRSRNGAKAGVAAVFMAGADLPAEERALADAVTARGWAEQNHVANDVFAVLWAATGLGARRGGHRRRWRELRRHVAIGSPRMVSGTW